jgi:hypothetical protein
VISDVLKEHGAFVIKGQGVESMDPLTLESEVIMFLLNAGNTNPGTHCQN